MYPFARLAKEFVVHRNAPPLGLFDTHVSHHVCWPWDLDFLAELNNGRTLTLYDLGRMLLGKRSGLFAAMRRRGWGLTVAGSSTRYRRRVTAFARLEMRSRLAGWDDRFMYLEQSMWHRGECTSHVLIRSAVIKGGRMVPTAEVLAEFGVEGTAPHLPDWIAAWAGAEALRPWPPMHEAPENNRPLPH
ncbi:thioeseterase [Meridianimarinicoccus roseus]|uniref:Thioeseterase n=1 Tax=Meridianimarinicoccus roseus TaxID=2072018 RepID=A0A2V2LBN7_9RHOB|nr:acyl-CoA thioesterase [Meridianimarinicoccus roseus]PWR02818.1 thioeseterase [Meridianimarinicoccus roseus]